MRPRAPACLRTPKDTIGTRGGHHALPAPGAWEDRGASPRGLVHLSAMLRFAKLVQSATSRSRSSLSRAPLEPSIPPAAERSWPSDCASPSADTIQSLRSKRNHHFNLFGCDAARFGELPEPSLLAARTAAKNEGSSFSSFAGDSAVIGVVSPSFASCAVDPYSNGPTFRGFSMSRKNPEFVSGPRLAARRPRTAKGELCC